MLLLFSMSDNKFYTLWSDESDANIGELSKKSFDEISLQISPQRPSAKNILKNFDIDNHHISEDVVKELDNLGFSYFKMFVSDGLKDDAADKLKTYEYRKFFGD